MNKYASMLVMLSISNMVSIVYADSCDLPNITKNIEQKLDTIEYYQVKVTSTLNNQQPAIMMMYGKRPDLLKVEMKVSDTDKLTIVFDKKYQWVEEGNNVYRIDLSKLTRVPERPFDTPYSLAGGLLSGEDYVGTIKTFLKVYDFKASCKGHTITLMGNLNIERFTQYTKTRNINVPLDQFVAQFAATLGKNTIKLDNKDYLIKNYTLEGKDKSAKFTAIFSDYKFDPLTNDQLAFKLPKGVKPLDITPGVRSSEPIPATDEDTKVDNE